MHRELLWKKKIFVQIYAVEKARTNEKIFDQSEFSTVRAKETRIDRWPIMSGPTINTIFLDSPIGGDRNSAVFTISVFTQWY